MSTVDNTLDSILIELGDLGKYQTFMFTLVCIGVVLHSGVHVAYVFTALDLQYRCKIEQCESDPPEFEPKWLKHAVPFESNSEPSKCNKYVLNNETSINCSDIYNPDITIKTEKCNSFVYNTEEKSILQDYDLQCTENLWKITLVGTINNLGQFFGIFISGIVSDKYGRKVVFILGLIFCGVCGLLRTVAPTYTWFIIMEFLDSAFGAGSFVCGFIIGVELVGPKKRVLTGTLISSCYALGEILAGGSAWIFKDWRTLIYILYGPPMLLFVYFWIIPESVRWNLSKGRVEQAKKTLRRVAEVNHKTIEETTLETLKATGEDASKSFLKCFSEIFKSPTLVVRLLNCIFCWINCTFLFYGITLNSVSLAEGNNYFDFMLTALVEIPAYVSCIYIVEKIGRKWSLSGFFFITGFSCFVFLFIPKHHTFHYVRLPMWMLGKYGATAAFTVAYLLTSELFPTPLRQTMMSTCSTLGRIGSMIAPQTPLLALIWTNLPVLLFTVMACIVALLVLLLPETKGIKLPDTIEEAAQIGKRQENT